ncbi:uncharacterized protein LOC144280411 [Canis aureus]
MRVQIYLPGPGRGPSVLRVGFLICKMESSRWADDRQRCLKARRSGKGCWHFPGPGHVATAAVISGRPGSPPPCSSVGAALGPRPCSDSGHQGCAEAGTEEQHRVSCLRELQSSLEDTSQGHQLQAYRKGYYTSPNLCHDIFRKDLAHVDIPENSVLIHCINDIMLIGENKQEVASI